jgi:two-component system response regulator AtoC
MASTNRDLRRSVAEGTFRLDLFYRLNVVHLAMPPLRERRQDVPLLADSFLKRFAAKYRREVEGFTPRAYLQMVSHEWPGNVRELEHAVERSVILSKDQSIDRLELDESPLAGASSAEMSSAEPEAGSSLPEVMDQPLSEYLAQCERQYLQTLLARHRGRVGEAARTAGVNPKTLYLKMNRHDLDKSEFRPRKGRSSGNA